jgi:hypothetical protein
LFWRRKPLIDVELPDSGADDHREAYRIKPDSERPIILNLVNNSYNLTNISGSGCCFRSHNYDVGFRSSGTLRIPSDDIIFPVTIRVVSKKQDLCHCEFEKISDRSADAIHAYVLEAQKSLLRNR